MNLKNKYFNKDFFISSGIGLIFLIFALIVEYFATAYATERASKPLTDIILSNIPIFNLANIFIYGIFALLIFIAFLTLIKPQRIPFITKSIALFTIIRSIFISLTHIGIYPNIISSNIDVFKNITSGGDMFF